MQSHILCNPSTKSESAVATLYLVRKPYATFVFTFMNRVFRVREMRTDLVRACPLVIPFPVAHYITWPV